jgi:hypothetical protein
VISTIPCHTARSIPLAGLPIPPLPEFSREERRQRVLVAASARLQVEGEMEQSCGISGPAKIALTVGAVCLMPTVLTQLQLSQN